MEEVKRHIITYNEKKRKKERRKHTTLQRMKKLERKNKKASLQRVKKKERKEELHIIRSKIIERGILSFTIIIM